MNYSELVQYIQDELENTETSFVDNIPNFVKLAEEEIYRDADLQFLFENATATLTISNQYLALPSDFISPKELSVTVSGSQYFLYQKDVAFIRSAYPSASTTGRPRYYAMFNEETIILGPTPDLAYAVELHYISQPESLVTASSNWLSTKALNALIYCTLRHAYLYVRGDDDVYQKFEANYQKALVRLKTLVEGQVATDDYKTPKKSIGKG